MKKKSIPNASDGRNSSNNGPRLHTIVIRILFLSIILSAVHFQQNPAMLQPASSMSSSTEACKDAPPAATEPPVKQRQSFTEILRESGSDKLDRHHYDRYYKNWLAPYRDQANMTFLEIGADQGKSLALWDRYFTLPKLIVGLAYGKPSAGVESKTETLDYVRVIRGDQSKKGTMDQLTKLGPWDIILDDGSHVPDHVIFSLFHLWPSVKPGGMYIIEDLETSYWKAGRRIFGYPLAGGINAGPKTNAANKLKQFVEILHRFHFGVHNLSIMPGDEWICSMEFGMNLVVFRKCTEQDMAESPNQAQTRPIEPEAVAKWLAQAKLSNPPGFV